MGIFRKKIDKEQPVVIEKNIQEELYPVIYTQKYVKERIDELSEEEVNISREIIQIKDSFGAVTENGTGLSECVDNFHDSFLQIGEVVGQFQEVEQSILDSVENAKAQVSVLQTDSNKVQESFDIMGQNFAVLMDTISEIREAAGGIIAIANQTNLLALNASIEAARAGEQGRGFAVVAEQVGKLSHEIKELVEKVNSSVEHVEEQTSEMSHTMRQSKEALEVSQEGVGKANEIFDQISHATHKVESVQESIHDVVNASEHGIMDVKNYVKQSNSQCDRVLEYISSIDHHNNRKSAIFEDIQNMLQQIEPLVKSVD